MRTTTHHTEGGRVDPRCITDCITLLHDARATLPTQLNGRPKAPSDPYAAQVRKEITQGRSQEFKRLYAVLACDLCDGVPLPTVLAPLRRMIAQLTTTHEQRTKDAATRPIMTLIRCETAAQAQLDLAQLRLCAQPGSRAALVEAVRCATGYSAILDELVSACERQMAVAS